MPAPWAAFWYVLSIQQADWGSGISRRHNLIAYPDRRQTLGYIVHIGL